MRQRTYQVKQSRAYFPASLLGNLPVYGEPLVAVIALLLWLAYIPSVNIRNMNDLGLVSILPIPIYIAMILVLLAFARAIVRREIHPPGLALILLISIFMLYGITALVEPEPRFATNYVHEGFSEYIRRTGDLATNLDARFSWPGFFIFGAFLPEIIGVPTTLTFLAWAPVFFNILYCLPLYAIYTSLTSDRRLAWLALWFFCLGNWVGQDYWSPQALNLFMFLVIVGILLRFFRVAPNQSSSPITEMRPAQESRWLDRFTMPVATRMHVAEPEPVMVADWQRAGLALSLIVIMFFIASSHQLTPFFVIAAVTALVVLNRVRLRTFLPITLVLTAVWISYMTVAFLSGHIHDLLADFGSVGSVVSANVGERIRGSTEHQIVVYVRILMTVAMGIVGVFGVIRRWFIGVVDIVPIALSITPFTMLIFQSYGGELILRGYFFALPFMAFLAAGLFFARQRGVPRFIHLAALVVVGIGFLAGFFLARYGNERMDYVTEEELEGINYVYATAPPGSALIIISPNLPLRYMNTEQYFYLPGLQEFYLAEITGVRELSQEQANRDVFVIITRTQKAYAELFYGLEVGWGDQLEQQLLTASDFKVLFQNRDASIFQYIDSERGTS
jgi:hypothetical protein